MGLSGKYVQMLSGNIPVLRGLSLLHGLKQIPGPFIHQIAVSKGAGSVLNGFESMVGQINMNLKQPEYAEKFHLNFYLNQGGRSEYNAFYTHKFNKWSNTFMAHYEDQSTKMIKIRMIFWICRYIMISYFIINGTIGHPKFTWN